ELAATSAANDELADNLRAMIDHLHDGMCLTDGHGHLIAFNPRFLTLFGVAPGAIAWGAHCRSLAAAFRDLDHLSATQRAVEAARRLRILTDPTLSCTLQSFPDGRTVDMARSAIAHDRWVVRLTDVSEVREVWRGLADERQSVEDRRRRRAASIAQMNHELRAPLNGILGMAALLKQTGLEPGQLKFVEVIHQSGDFLLRMIEDTQSIAQLEAGSLPLMRERFALGRLVTETVEALRPVAEDKGLTLRIDGTSALLPEVMGDRQRLAQCLANLMTNAIRYTDRGFVGVTLAVKARAGSLDVRIDVADSGIGISAEHHDRVFEQFYQVRDGDTRRGGVGLGLAITRGIMQAMGGSVSLSSTPGNGSTFTLSVALPVASTAHATPLPSQQAATG
ncbi:MAG: ATP-binding protein, partial [Pseudomonadota bacterium]